MKAFRVIEPIVETEIIDQIRNQVVSVQKLLEIMESTIDSSRTYSVLNSHY